MAGLIKIKVHHGGTPDNARMTLLHWNMLTVSISCFLLIGGFSLRHRRGIPVVLMLLGIVGLLSVLTYNVHHLAG